MSKILSLLLLKRVWIPLFIILAIYAAFPTRATWHRELTLHIQAPDGPLRASAVSRVKYVAALKWAGDMDRPRATVQGEAVYADLGGKPLFALMAGNDGFRILVAHNFWVGEVRNGRKIEAHESGRQKEPLEVPIRYYPRLVTFEDVNDPSSVMLVDPGDFAAIFGEAYALEKITTNATRLPMTKGVVENVLGWWLNYRNERGGLKSLRLLNDSPRGWEHLGARNFWSLDRVIKFGEEADL